MSSSTATRRRLVGLDLLIEIPAIIITFAMMLLIAANAVLRTWFDRPIDNSLELVQYWLLPALALLGFVAAQSRSQHITTDLVYKFLPGSAQRVVLTLGFVVSAVVAVGFAWFGWSEALHNLEIRRTAGVSTLPSWPVYFLVPLSFGLLAAQWAVAAVRAMRGEEFEDAEGVPDGAEELSGRPEGSTTGGAR
jgi:TRAP-type C4-dicarboxylate transport system permease small subunit